MEPSDSPCEQDELTCAAALQALPDDEVAAVQVHIGGCRKCRREMAGLRPVVGQFVHWPTDVLCPTASLQPRLALRIAEETDQLPLLPRSLRWSEPDWEQVAPGIECKLLATDTDRHRVTMLVRLAPNARYPAHTHAGTEELHLLDGELWIDGRKLRPGDYSHATRGSADKHVWSETGCTCLLVTSTEDVLS